MSHKKFRKLENRIYLFKEAVDSGEYLEYLNHCNITPEMAGELNDTVVALSRRRTEIEKMREGRKRITKREREVTRELKDIANPIVNYARRKFPDSELRAGLSLNTRYTTRARETLPASAETEADATPDSERWAVRRVNTRDNTVTRFRIMGQTLEELTDEEKAIFARGGIDEEHINSFLEKLAEVDKLFRERPLLESRIAMLSQDWSVEYQAADEIWRDWCSNMRAQLFSRRIAKADEIFQALAMGC